MPLNANSPVVPFLYWLWLDQAPAAHCMHPMRLNVPVVHGFVVTIVVYEPTMVKNDYGRFQNEMECSLRFTYLSFNSSICFRYQLFPYHH